MKKLLIVITIFIIFVSGLSFATTNKGVIHGRFLEYSFVPNDIGQIVTVLKLIDDTFNEYEFYYHIDSEDLENWVNYDYYFSFDNNGEVESIQVVDVDIMGNETLICDE